MSDNERTIFDRFLRLRRDAESEATPTTATPTPTPTPLQPPVAGAQSATDDGGNAPQAAARTTSTGDGTHTGGQSSGGQGGQHPGADPYELTVTIETPTDGQEYPWAPVQGVPVTVTGTLSYFDNGTTTPGFPLASVPPTFTFYRDGYQQLQVLQGPRSTSSPPTHWATWSAVILVPVPPGTPPVSTHTLSVRVSRTPTTTAADSDQSGTSPTITTKIDSTQPTLSLSSLTPQVSGQSTVPSGSGVTTPIAIAVPNGGGMSGAAQVTLTGTAADADSGMRAVQWRLNGGTWNDAQPDAHPLWSHWQASFAIPALGVQLIEVQGLDNVGNTTGPFRIYVEVALSYTYQGTTPLAYLFDLVSFALQRIMRDGVSGQYIGVNDVDAQLFQPIGALVSALTLDESAQPLANAPIRKLRLNVEILRQYLAHIGQTLPVDAERAYCQLAYETLLATLGTSYDELCMARTGDDTTRSRVAAQLGITYDMTHPEQLNQFLVQPSQLSETTLDALFGLRTTSLALTEPFKPHHPSTLFSLRQAHLRQEWAQEDHSDSAQVQQATSVALPIIEPDVVGSDEVRTTPQARTAMALYQQRLSWVRGQAQTLQQLAQKQQFRDLVASVVPLRVLTDLAHQWEVGQSIDAALTVHYLELDAFLMLIHLQRVEERSELLDSEWDDIVAILLQVQKRAQYSTWRAEEKAQGITLSPDFFTIADSQVLADVPRWRATTHDRLAWVQTWQARREQVQEVGQDIQAALDLTEEAALPQLCTALVTALGAHLPGLSTTDPDQQRDWLTERLLVDVACSATLMTTRVDYAIETLQSLLFALRTGRFENVMPRVTDAIATWTLGTLESQDLFDQEWQWMGAYSSWRAALTAFLYPESLLLPLPSLLSDIASNEYLAWAADPDSPQVVTPATARALAASYATSLPKTVQDDLENLLGADVFATLKGATSPMEQRSPADLVQQRTSMEGWFHAADETLRKYLRELFYFVPMQIAQRLQHSGAFPAALDWYRLVYDYTLQSDQRKIAYPLVEEEQVASDYHRAEEWLRADNLNPHTLARKRRNAYTFYTLLALAECFVEYGDAAFASGTAESFARARALYLDAKDLLATLQALDTGRPATQPPNPSLAALQQHVEMDLHKLRSGLNIAGLQLSQHLDATTVARPTPYRYTTLVDRAKQFVALAQQMEAAFLGAIEKSEAAQYTQIMAKQDLNLANSTVALQQSRYAEAKDGVALANQQAQRARIQQDTYKQWIAAGKNDAENQMISAYQEARDWRNITAGLDAAITVAQVSTTAASGGFFGTGVGASWGPALAASALAAVRGSAQMEVNSAEMVAQIASANASFERRKDEWKLQANLAAQDYTIGQQQITLAKDHVEAVRQEYQIAQAQAQNAQDRLNYLTSRFTNAELYAWMSDILEGVYSFFLQQATAISRVAQSQLAFERQQRVPAYIRDDYWQAPTSSTSDGSATPTTGGASAPVPDRRGLTGSERLLQDIYQLDQYAFETNKRKLQITKTFSLAQLAPLDFQRFRSTGALYITTPMSLFDQDFPGQYLRLVKRIRVSVVALIPPNQGIHATLASSGVSRIVAGQPGYTALQPIAIQRDPELVALSSPMNATGLFELDTQAEMLLPFESMGVDATWELQLPKAANRFDYRSIADVLFTVEYTALYDGGYRTKVVQQLANTVSADKSISLRNDYADSWYDLHHAQQVAHPWIVTFTLSPDDFPPNLADIRLQQVMVAFLRSKGSATKELTGALRFTPSTGVAPAPSPAVTTVGGVISTRRANGTDWLTSIIGEPPSHPFGEWTLDVSMDTVAQQMVADNDLEDIVFVLTYQATTPSWP